VHQTRAEEHWNKTIYEHLPYIDGLKVQTSVRLTTHRELRSFEVEHRRPTVLVSHELDYHFSKEGFDRFGRPGQIAQFGRTLIDPTADTSARDKVDEKKRESEITNALPGIETTREDLPYIPVAVLASIQIPRDHILAVWRERNRFSGSPETSPTDAQLQAIENGLVEETKRSVAILLQPYRNSNKEDPMEFVEVTFFDRFLPIEVELSTWEQFKLFMMQHWQNLGLMSLVFCGLTVLWLISKPQKPDNIVIYEGLETPLEALDARIAEKIRRQEEEAAAAAAAVAEDQEELENTLGDLGSIRSLKDEIAELIARNPEAAAAVIRQWIGNAVLVEAKN
jgi:flagellar M-ring protein FliF